MKPASLLALLALGLSVALSPATLRATPQSPYAELVPVKGVSFTLANRSLKSIPLHIPGVMNPNLSPMSNSGVSLAVGQEIFFYEGRKKVLLLTVTEDLQDQTLIVNDLIRERQKELAAGQGASPKKRKGHKQD